MNRRIRSATSLVLCGLMLFSGCQPVQPFYFKEDGDLSHYLNVATDIEYPDVDETTPENIMATRPPLTIKNFENYDFWDISLEELTRHALRNSDVIRSLGGRITDGGQGVATAVPQTLSTNPNAAVTTYDAALVETGNGTATGSAFSGTGVEAALSEFDAQLDANLLWQKNDRPQNFGGFGAAIFATDFQQDLGTNTIGVTKTAADGTTFEMRNNINYDANNNFGSRVQPSSWDVNFEAAVTHPLLQGRGTQYNRIAGPQTFQQATGQFANAIDGVVIARIRQDVTLADFQQAVRDLMSETEDAYWELYFAYRDLEARKIGLNSALETWRVANAELKAGTGNVGNEAQTRSQVYLFQAQVETALTNLLRVESNLRYLIGLEATDGRLIRPSDQPTIAAVHFDWASIHAEALARRSELRQQKWNIKRRELELIASRNQLLPRLDLVGRYRWLGAGDDLLNSGGTGVPPFGDDSNAFEVLTTGDYQEWEAGLQLTMPFGFRRALSGVRHFQLLLAQERAKLNVLEQEVSHQLSHSIRDIDTFYQQTTTNLNRRAATEDEVDAIQVLYDVGTQRLDVLLQSQQRRADAESAYYRALVEYNKAIKNVHLNKGSLLEYNGVYLAEGPWPNKAYFDALNRARRRDASIPLNYGFTRPDVISRGPQNQFEPIPPGDYIEPMPLGDAGDAIESSNETPLNELPNGEMIPTPAAPEAGALGPQSATPAGAPSAAPANPWATELAQPAELRPLPMQRTGGASDYTQTSPPSNSSPVAAPSQGLVAAAATTPTTPTAVQPASQPNATPTLLPSASETPANPFRNSPTEIDARGAEATSATTFPYEPQPNHATTTTPAAPAVR